ncbi:unnamed protein product, partial [Thelazia callipaeda]|uniref:Carboxypeptidase n=1 Tax=Thelazia callipaeda TaxID=103827 RepID=A0A0N5CRP3_THECL
DPYNTYQDCYLDEVEGSTEKNRTFGKIKKKTSLKSSFETYGARGFIDQGARINIGSTDAQYGLPCWVREKTHNYLNLKKVREALHIPLTLPEWQECSDEVFESYQRERMDMMSSFDDIINSGFPLRILIYNGDVDTVCNFLGNEWFLLNLVQNHSMSTSMRYSWSYQKDTKYEEQLGGYSQNFTHCDSDLKTCVSINFVTVKGAGHFVPMDRPGPSLQLITNFIQNININTSLFWNTTAKPTLPQYITSKVIPATRKENDRIIYLPGLTFPVTFKQYSGFLKSVPGDYLHYFFVESKRNPARDPLVLWLNGGPGCSSLEGLFLENGPFHPNPDGTTLFENIYSWNQIANVLYLESPRNVGFSWQNTSINKDPTYNDLKASFEYNNWIETSKQTNTARGAFYALMDFLEIFPEYRNRRFYITGESYAGIYIPTLTSYIIKKIYTNQAPGLNLIGIAIGNGELSMRDQLNSIISMLYFRGVYGKDLYARLMACCENNTIPAAFCNFDRYVIFINGWALPKDFSNECAKAIAEFGSHYIWFQSKIQDPYNLIEDGYRQFVETDMQSKLRTNLHKRKFWAEYLRKGFNQSSAPYDNQQSSAINYASTDGKGNFYFYARSATTNYLNLKDVRSALHIPEHIQPWEGCNDDINYYYYQQYEDTTPIFEQIIHSGYTLDILIYNGDVDLVCEFLGNEWFTERLAKSYKMNVTRKRSEWTYEGERAGYWKQFRSPIGNLDLVSVKVF